MSEIMNPLYIHASNFNNMKCVAFPFTYDENISPFMLAYGLYKRINEINPNVINVFDDIYDETILGNFDNGKFTKLNQDLFGVPFGYDGVKINITISDKVWSTHRDPISHFDNNMDLHVPIIIIGDTKYLRLDIKDNQIVDKVAYVLASIKMGSVENGDYRSIVNKYLDLVKPFEDNLEYMIGGAVIKYTVIKSYEQFKQVMPDYE